jgi:hypothetical protein
VFAHCATAETHAPWVGNWLDANEPVRVTRADVVPSKAVEVEKETLFPMRVVPVKMQPFVHV